MNPREHLRAPIPAARPALERWSDPGAGKRYGGARFRSPRAAERDPRLVRSLLATFGLGPDAGGVLDVPCGAGRLRPLLDGVGSPYVGLDASDSMLAANGAPFMVRADGLRLPFSDASFELVVCCRLLHHLILPQERSGLVRELVRVSSRLVLLSFWDAGSLHAWRRRKGLRLSRRHDARVPISRKELTALLHDAGAEPCAFRASWRFVSPQTFVAARKRTAT